MKSRKYFDSDVIGGVARPSDQWSDLPLAAASLTAHEATEAGIQTAHDHANEQWKQTAYAAIVEIARRQPKLSADDVWRHLGGSVTCTHNPSALGPLFRIAAARQIIRKAHGELVKSVLLIESGPRAGESRRHREVQVWHSLIVDNRVENSVHKSEAVA